MNAERSTQSPETKPLPNFELMIPIVAKGLPQDPENWLSEVIWNGQRVLVTIIKGTKTYQLITQSGLDISGHFRELDKGFNHIGRSHTVVMDGTLVYGSGKTDDEKKILKSKINADEHLARNLRRILECKYIPSDILYLDGQDLRNLSQIQRKTRLEMLLTETVRKKYDLVPNLFEQENHQKLVQVAQAQGFKEVIFKRSNSLYRDGKRSDWQKMRLQTKSST